MKQKKIEEEPQISEEEEQTNEENQSEFNIEELDDIELDPLEIEAYNRILLAKQKIEYENMTEEDKKKIAKSILPSTENINNEERLNEILEEIKLDEPWSETLHITSKTKLVVENIEDDIDRELQFYNQALESAYTAWDRMRKHDIPLIRPEDYFAEMLKSDEHMNKIKEKLLHNKQQVEKKEDNKKRKEQRKYGKKIQEEKLKEKIQKKKQNIEAIQQWKKNSKGKEYDIDVLENNIKEREENKLSDASLFSKFKKEKRTGKSAGVQKKGKDKKEKKRPGKSKRRHK